MLQNISWHLTHMYDVLIFMYLKNKFKFKCFQYQITKEKKTFQILASGKLLSK